MNKIYRFNRDAIEIIAKNSSEAWEKLGKIIKSLDNKEELAKWGFYEKQPNTNPIKIKIKVDK